MTHGFQNPVIVISSLGDNYIYLYKYQSDKVFAIDPSDASDVFDILKANSLQLTHIFVTHHHWDHTAGIADLKQITNCIVIGPDKRIPHIDQITADDQIIDISQTQIKTILTPGHTTTSVCYYVLPSGTLFTGDTLFVNGCGRLLESDPAAMFNSLKKIAKLPSDTLIYPGHDYTLENYQFALTIEPNNQTLIDFMQQALKKLKQGLPTVPSTIARELSANPFLRSDSQNIKNALNMPSATDVETFAQLRKKKDTF